MGKEVPGELERNGRKETIYFDFIYLPIRDDQERITGITVVATDATSQVLARQKTEADLRESEALGTSRSRPGRAATGTTQLLIYASPRHDCDCTGRRDDLRVS